MAAVRISDPYSFLPEDEIGSDIFSSNNSFFRHITYEERSRTRENYDFYTHLRTKPLDENIKKVLFGHKQTSDFTWATSIHVSEQISIYAVFSPSGLNIWQTGGEEFSAFVEIQPVKNRNACFVDCVSTIALLFTYDNKTINVINDITNLEISTFKLTDGLKIRTFGQSSQENALIITENSQAITLNVPTLTSKIVPLNKFLKYLPLRQRNVGDSIIFTVFDKVIYAASYSHLSIFNDDFSLQKSIRTPIGKPEFLSVTENAVFLILYDEEEKKQRFVHILNLFDNPSVNELNFSISENMVQIAAIEDNVCCIATKWHIYLLIITDITLQPSVTISKCFEDYLLACNTISDHNIAILTAREGIHYLDILPFNELLQLIPQQVNRVSVALQLYASQFPNIDLSQMFSELKKYNVSKTAFLVLDENQILSLSNNMNINENLELHISLVRLFLNYHNYFHSSNDSPSAKTDDFELNAYNLISLKKSIDFINDKKSCEFYVIKSAINQKDSTGIFKALDFDIKNNRFELVDLLIDIANDCYLHYSKWSDVYQSKIICPKQILKLIHSALSLFKYVKNVDDGNNFEFNYSLDDYIRLCELSIQISREKQIEKDINKAIEYALVLLNISVDNLEELGLKLTVEEILAEIIHNTTKINEKCNKYYELLGEKCIDPILKYLSKKQYTADILEIGELPEWKNHVPEALNYDSTALGFHYISEKGSKLELSAEFLWQAINDGITANSLSLDQAASLCSIALMCCYINGKPKKLKTKIERKIYVLEIQKTSGIQYGQNNDSVMPSKKLIDYFIALNNPTTALGIYISTAEERNDQENGVVLAKILFLYEALIKENGKDKFPLLEIFQESQLGKFIPKSIDRELRKTVKVDEIYDFIIDTLNQVKSHS